jgi:hypothetical protein
MDVVDTLRHNKRLVERELGSEQREHALIARLREIYTAQGIEVTDEILAAGVRALDEERFHYTPPKAGFQTWLAGLYVSRERWGKPLLIALLVLAVVGFGYRFGMSYWQGQQAAVIAEAPAELARELEAVRSLGSDPAAEEAAQQIEAQAQAAIATEDRQALAAALSELQALKTRLQQQYVIRIVARPGERSGVFRVPAANPSAQNFYLVVEAIGPEGQALPMSITSEEDGRTQTVERWGLRVEESVYQAVAADKQDDGIIQRQDIGSKEPGRLEPRYSVPVAGGAITQW